MCSPIPQLILSEQMIAYALADAGGWVHSVCGDPAILWGCDDAGNGIGQSLLALVPELTDSEGAVQALLVGEIEYLRFESLNREDSLGNRRYITLAVYRHREPDTQAVGLLFVAQDVTAQGIVRQELMQRHNELHLLQDRLERQNLELAASNAELRLTNDIRSSFISAAAHELRTPLTSIYGFLELLQDTGVQNLTPMQRGYLESIDEGAQRLLVTLNELLDVARIDSDRVELVLRPIRLSGLIEKIALTFAPQLAARRQQLDVTIPANLPHALCDPDRLDQVLGHLLGNASKFTPAGGTVGLAVHPSAAAEEFILIAVSDQGHGIEMADERRLFERFYRDEHVRKNGTAGAGLGLYITRSLVELHGGEIWYESRPGRGTTFYVTVPVATPMLSSTPHGSTRAFNAI